MMPGSSSSSSSNKWIRELNKSPLVGPVKLQVFFFPFAGGRVDVYGSWLKSPDFDFPCQSEWIGLELPGHGVRTTEPVYDDGPALFKSCAMEIKARLRPGVPYCLFGHSMGTVFVVGVGRELAALGAPSPARGFVSARCPSHVKDPDGSLCGLTDEELCERLKSFGGWNEALEHEQIRKIYFPVIRADSLICHEVLDVEPLLDFPLSVVYGNEECKLKSMVLRWPELVAERWIDSCTQRDFAGHHMWCFDKTKNTEFLQHFRELLLLAANSKV